MAEITPAGDPKYKTAIRILLMQIEGNPVGRVIIQAIKATGKDLQIQPMSAWPDGDDTSCQALTWPDDRSTATWKGTGGTDTSFRGKRYFGKKDIPETARDDRNDTDKSGEVAAGGGSSTQLYFTPGVWSSCGGQVSGTLADEVLTHELVHALRMMQGYYNPVPTVEKKYTNEEEFLAVVVANVYISAKDGKRKLMADHDSYDHLKPPLDTSRGFLDDPDNLRVLSHYFFHWRIIVQQLASLSTPKFNPFSELFGAIQFYGSAR